MINIKLYKPHKYQIPVHKACNDKETFFITVNAGRQSGKTYLAIQQCIYWMLNEKNQKVFWVSPIAGQSISVYKKFLNVLRNMMPVVKSHKGSMGSAEILFTNGSQIKFRSAAQGDNLRGETENYVVLDEAADIPKEIIDSVLLPILTTSGKKVLTISTPKGKNHFYNQFNKGFQDDPKYKSFKFTSYDSPFANKEFLDIMRRDIPDVIFRQEYLGEFVDSTAIFENINELATIEQIHSPQPGHNYYMGIDIALKDDYTVINVMNQDMEVVYYERYNHITAPQLKENIIKCINNWKPKKILIEENNQGLPIMDDLKITHKIKNIVGFKTTSSSKPEIINNLINAFASKKIKVPNCETYKRELEMFTMTISSTGTPKFQAPSGFNDDIVMSLAITLQCFNQFRYNGMTSFVSINI